MDWPLAAAYAALFCVTLVYIGHESEMPPKTPVASIGSSAISRPTNLSTTASIISKVEAPLPSAVAASKPAAWFVPDIAALPNDSWGKTVRQGRDLTVATYAHIGPEVADPAKRFAGSNMSCQSCHLEAGTKQYGLPFIGVFADFPQYRSREGEVGTLEDRINGCMTRSLNGRALPVESEEMKAFVSYIKFLSTGRPIGAQTPGRGSGEMAELWTGI
jgi:thiosulfate dehydrogenase